MCRYDGRGHLFDLRPYDADNTDQRGELSSDEQRIERLCEEERYLELHTDIAERAIQEGWSPSFDLSSLNICVHKHEDVCKLFNKSSRFILILW